MLMNEPRPLAPTSPHLAPGAFTTSPPRPRPIGRGEGAHSGDSETSPLEIDCDARLKASAQAALKAKDAKRQERAATKKRRDYGVQARHREKLAWIDAAAVVDTSGTRCRYLVSEQPPTPCPNERVPGGELCRPHLARAAQLARRLGLNLEGERS
jgi:hypothetical protein